MLRYFWYQSGQNSHTQRGNVYFLYYLIVQKKTCPICKIKKDSAMYINIATRILTVKDQTKTQKFKF